MSLLSVDSLERVRILACDLAEHWVVRVGQERAFTVWVEDGDVQSFTATAQDHFNRASDIIEHELLCYVAGDHDAGVVVDALVEYGDAAMIKSILSRLHSEAHVS